MSSHTWPLVIVFILWAAAAFAQRVDIGGVELSFGTNQERALDLLAKRYEVKPLDTGSFVLVRKDAKGFEPVGTVEFEGGKLTKASRQWVDDDATTQSENIVKGLFALLGDGSASSTSLVVIRTRLVQDPGTDARLPYLYPPEGAGSTDLPGDFRTS